MVDAEVVVVETDVDVEDDTVVPVVLAVVAFVVDTAVVGLVALAVVAFVVETVVG